MEVDFEGFFSEECIFYETQLIKNPFSLKSWLEYLRHNEAISNKSLDHPLHSFSLERARLYERALFSLPQSYKLWNSYLDEMVGTLASTIKILREQEQISSNSQKAINRQLSSLIQVFERALSSLPFCPSLWTKYVNFLCVNRLFTRVRIAIDRALRALPVTLHRRLWGELINNLVILESEAPKLATFFAKRFWTFCENTGEYGQFFLYYQCLLNCQEYNDAAELLCTAYDEPGLSTFIMGDQNRNFFEEFCSFAKKFGKNIDITRIEGCFRKFIENNRPKGRKDSASGAPVISAGYVWNSLATLHIHKSDFFRAFDIFEEGLNSINSLEDYYLIFDAYTRTIESIIYLVLRSCKSQKKKDTKFDVIGLMDRLEKLIKNQSLMIAEIRLRKDEGNIEAWLDKLEFLRNHHRAENEIIETFQDAASTMEKLKHSEKSSLFWIYYAEFFEKQGNAEQARETYHRAVKAISNEQELTKTILAFCDMESRISGMSSSLQLLKRLLILPQDEAHLSNHMIEKNSVLWNRLVDLQELSGTIDEVSDMYELMISNGVATPQNFVNFSTFLEQNQNIEGSFGVLLKGINAFGYPVAFELWNVLLPKYMNYYREKNQIERVRSLFESSILGCPKNFVHIIFINYCKFEQDNGYYRNAFKILERGLGIVSLKNQHLLFDLQYLLAKSHLGVSAQRSVLDNAIKTLSIPDEIISFSLKFAFLETGIGEYDRARAIFTQAAAQADPKKFVLFWSEWQEFETKYGTESTFRDMLQVKRSVEFKYPSTAGFIQESSLNPLVQNSDEIQL